MVEDIAISYNIKDSELVKMMEELPTGVYTEQMRDRYNMLIELSEFIEGDGLCVPEDIVLGVFEEIIYARERGSMMLFDIDAEHIDAMKDVLSSADPSGYKFEWSERFGECPWVRDNEYECYRCHKTFYKSDMVLADDMVATDHSAACPECNAKSLPIGRRPIPTGKFRIIER